MLTNSEFGDASVLDEAWPVIAQKVAEKIPPATVGVITGFIGTHAREMAGSHAAHRLAFAPTREAGAIPSRACVGQARTPRAGSPRSGAVDPI